MSQLEQLIKEEQKLYELMFTRVITTSEYESSATPLLKKIKELKSKN
jgi:hypothetical protein